MDVIVGVSFVFVTSTRKSFTSVSISPSEAKTLMPSTATSLFEGVPDKTPVVASNSNQEGASINSKINGSSSSS